MSYSEKFKDPRWQKKRLTIFERDDFKCVSCNNTKNTLHAHHLCYIQGYDPWDYDDIFIVTLCNECHNYFHEEPQLSERYLLKSLTDADMEKTFGENQRHYDLCGMLVHFREKQITIKEDCFTSKKVERIFNKNDSSITFKLTNEDF